MKIVFLSARYPPDFIGGGELSTAAIADGIAARGHDVTVLTGARADAQERRGTLTIIRSRALFPLWAKPLFERQTCIGMLPALQKLIPAETGVVHAHDFRSALLLSLLEHPRRAVTVRDFAAICGTTNNMWWDGTSCDGCFWPNVLFRCHRVVEASPARKPFRVWQYKYNLGFRGEAFRAIPHHVYISRALQGRIATRMAIPPHTEVIPNPVGAEWLAPPVPYPAAPRAVYAGTVESYKGIGVLLDAFATVLRELSRAELEIIGAGDISGYGKQAARLGIAESVRFLEKLPPAQVRERFDAARVVVQPSLWEEPFGRTVIEAYARSRPVIASDTGGLHDTVSAQTGILVPPRDVSALATALRRLLSDTEEARSFGAAGRARVERQFATDQVAEQYEQFYRRMS
jgi:glycosyltransferase involved in cell wall biosynthesis